MAVPPDLVGFVEAAGLAAVAYGLDTQAVLGDYRNFWTSFFRNFWRIQDLIRLWREVWEPVARCWGETSTTLTSLADGADLLFTGLNFEEAAANVAEYYDIPLATLHYVPGAGQRPARSDPAVAVGPLRNDGERVAVLAPDEEARGRASP